MTTPSKPICVLMPAFNEEKKIGPVVAAALVHAPVIVVDDGSKDGTAAVAERAGATVLIQAVNQGKGAALRAGFEYARKTGFEAVITMDSDGQHDPGEIPKFMETYVRTGTPALVGNRMADIKDMPLIRKWTNRFMSSLLSRRMGQYVPDTQCGYRLYRCDLLPFVTADSRRFAAESEILLNLSMRGIRIDSVRVRTIYGDEKSKINPIADTIRFFRMLRRYKPCQKFSPP